VNDTTRSFPTGGSDGRHSPFEALLPGPPVETSPLLGTPAHDAQFFDGRQSFADTCAIRSQEFILQQFTGMNLDEDALVREAFERGWYTPGQGTPCDCVGNLLELHGVAVNRYAHADIFQLADELHRGRKVIIGVRADDLWSPPNPVVAFILSALGFDDEHPADHAVVVSGIDTTDPEQVHVIVSDPGTGDAVASYPMGQFLHAWKASDFFMVATQDPAPSTLPEMVHFDYAAGHLADVGDVSFEEFQALEHHPDAVELLFGHDVGDAGTGDPVGSTPIDEFVLDERHDAAEFVNLDGHDTQDPFDSQLETP